MQEARRPQKNPTEEFAGSRFESKSLAHGGKKKKKENADGQEDVHTYLQQGGGYLGAATQPVTSNQTVLTTFAAFFSLFFFGLCSFFFTPLS